MDTEPLNLLNWIIPLITGILGGLIGFQWGRKSRGTDRNQGAGHPLSTTQGLSREEAPGRERVAEAGPLNIPDINPFDPKAARMAMGRRVKRDDLTVVDGIGPKIRTLFHNFQITTWEDLANSTVQKCQEVLDSGGDRYRTHDPASWPMQARMAQEGRWKDLARWQKKHRYGKI